MTKAKPTTRPAPQRQDFVRFMSISSRWMDNDVYGHINNVHYYSFFDTAVNQLLIEAGLLDPGKSPVMGLVVENQCTYRESLSYPDMIEVGVRVGRVGQSSVRYELGIFRQGAQSCAAHGYFVHVYVDAQTRRPTPIPAACLAFFKTLQIDPAP